MLLVSTEGSTAPVEIQTSAGGVVTTTTHEIPSGFGPRFAFIPVTIDVPDIVEFFQDVALPSPGGARLPITKQFRAIVTVTHSLENTGGAATFITSEDKGIGSPFLTAGPLLIARNNGGAPTTASCDALVKGY